MRVSRVQQRQKHHQHRLKPMRGAKLHSRSTRLPARYRGRRLQPVRKPKPLSLVLHMDVVKVIATNTGGETAGRAHLPPSMINGRLLEMVETELIYDGKSLGQRPRPVRIEVNTLGISVNQELLVAWESLDAPTGE
ncbi:MAG: hypothetical protein ACI841_002103 [Planctomycetota bacterium]|jgi:hypothetical protein